MPTTTIPTPQAVTIDIVDAGGGDWDIGVIVAPSLPDDGGIWNLYRNEGLGPELRFSTDALVGNMGSGATFADFSAVPAEWWVVQEGGGVQFVGTSPESNHVSNV